MRSPFSQGTFSTHPQHARWRYMFGCGMCLFRFDTAKKVGARCLAFQNCGEFGLFHPLTSARIFSPPFPFVCIKKRPASELSNALFRSLSLSSALLLSRAVAEILPLGVSERTMRVARWESYRVCFFFCICLVSSPFLASYIRTHTQRQSSPGLFFCSLRPLFRVTQRDIHSAPLLYRTHSPRRSERNGAHTSESAHRAVCVL